MTFAGLFAGHKLDDALPVFAAAFRAELFLKDRQHGPVKLLRLCHTHLVHFEANDREGSARKYFDHAASTQIWEAEIVPLNEHESFLGLRATRKRHGVIYDSTIRIRKFRPQFQIALDRARFEFSDHSRL